MEKSKELLNDVARLQKEGYVALPVRHIFGKRAEGAGAEWKDVVNMALGSSEGMSANPDYTSPGSVEIPVGSGIGTKGLGYMTWGSNNRLPNTIGLLVSLLPYTAAGVKFNTDVTSGLGPRAKYRFSRYVNGTVQTEKVDYASAGILLKGEILERKNELMRFYQQKRMDANALPYRAMEKSDKEKLEDQMEEQLKGEIDKAQQDYDKWEETKAWLDEFLGNFNSDMVFLQLANDMNHMGICFPELVLDRQSGVEDTAQWKPKVIALDYRSCCTCRLERMDKRNRINYVYVSNQWLDTNQQTGSIPKDSQIAAIPALESNRPLRSLQEKVADTRIRAYTGRKNRQGKDVSERPTRFILPTFYPSMGRSYYPQPAWHSIFFGDIYKYCATLIENRRINNDNRNMAGRIIYVHTEYLHQLYLQEKATKEEDKEKLRDRMWNEINEFLKEKNNNGQTILSFTFIGNDGKEHDAWRIVNVPMSSQSEAEANKTELLEVSSIIFFALNIHPFLIGAVPGTSSGGGTYQREMYELKKLLMVPTQRIMLKAYEVARDFSGMDSHLEWEVQQMTLTTLDRNANGIEETKV